LTEPVEATDVYLHIFEPNVNTSDPGYAILVSGVALYRGEGVFEYEYTVPSNATAGAWHDVWYGYSPNQTLSGLFTFDVVSTGYTEVVENQLFNNNVVVVTIPSGLMATDGTSLSEEYSFEFMTTTSPSYTNIRKVRLEVGGYISSVYDDAIQTAILEASIEADALTFVSTRTNSNVFQHARREYVSCLASYLLVQNTGNQMLKSKTLADLEVGYDTSGLRNVLDKLRECMGKWEPQIMAGGGAKALNQPSYVVKGELDPERPGVSRMWSSGADGTVNARIPAANTRLKSATQRRYLRTYTRIKWW
jgi:hypothetical protein